MGVDSTSSARRRQWHIDRVNNATSPVDQLSYATAYVRGELAKCQTTRPADAAGLYRQLAHMIATFAAEVHKARAALEFRESFPALPGGGWAPKPASDARHP
jgi:hypothetical protein